MSRIIINCVITVDQGLVDEVLFWVNPTIQGPGERPFPARRPDRPGIAWVTKLRLRCHVVALSAPRNRRNP
jgi:hypothetical protein